MKKICVLFTLVSLTVTIQAQEVKINNNLVVEADGTIKYLNSATVFEDLMVYPDATTKGASAPTWTLFKNNGAASQGVYLWMFSPSTEQELYFTIQLPHSYKTGSDIYPHVHWSTTTGTPSTSDVVWGLEYTVVSMGGIFGNSTIINTTGVIGSITPSGTGQHLISSFPAISGTSLGISTILVCRLFRNVSHTSDAFANSTGLLGFDVHYEKDTDGSRTEYTK